MTIVLAILFGLFLAYANGANDNFKGVATLYGSGTATYKGALTWASLATALGSMTALIVAQGLLATFSGKGLVPDAVVAMKSFTLAVGLAAAATVMLATRLGFPISTTHALTGALVGAGFLASDAGVNFSKLGTTFFMPLLLSPVVAVAGAAAAYFVLNISRKGFAVKNDTCICVGTETLDLGPLGQNPQEALATFQVKAPTLTIDSTAACANRYTGPVAGVRAVTLLDGLHYLSGGVVCFARALNDTPKIAATLLVGGTFSPSIAIAGAATAMGVGGLLHSRRIAETMAHKVTTLNPGQGLSANLVTGLLVIFAAKLGLPVSTTHVSVGSLFGIGTVTRQAQYKTIVNILMAWVTTLPAAALLGAGLFWLLEGILR